MIWEKTQISPSIHSHPLHELRRLSKGPRPGGSWTPLTPPKAQRIIHSEPFKDPLPPSMLPLDKVDELRLSKILHAPHHLPTSQAPFYQKAIHCRRFPHKVYSTYTKKKRLLAETTSMTVWLCRYKLISTRHKRSSGRPVSEAALYFGNLCVYEPSGYRKKPSDMQHSCATNACLEIHMLQTLVSFFLTHTMPLQVLV